MPCRRRILATLTLAALAHASPAPAQPAPPVAIITLREAFDLTLERNPDARVLAARARAAAARRHDAGRLANPELSVIAENLGARDRRETAVLLSQALELGGDRMARRDVATALVLLGAAELEAEQRVALAVTADRYFEVWGLQERLALLRRSVNVADEAIHGARERHRQGAAPVTERMRAEAQRALRATEVRRAEAEIVAARVDLALQWGGEPAVDSVALVTPEADAIPSADSLVARLSSHPERLAAAASIAAEEARVREARAARIPDVAVHGGVRRLEEIDDYGFEAGVTVALPIWNRSNGAIGGAIAERDAAMLRSEASRRVLVSHVRNTHARLEVERSALAELRANVTPKAREALSLVRNSYRAGRSSYLDLTEAQRAVVEAELAELEAALGVWRARAGLVQLTGMSLYESGGGR